MSTKKILFLSNYLVLTKSIFQVWVICFVGIYFNQNSSQVHAQRRANDGTKSWVVKDINRDAFFIENVGQYAPDIAFGLRKNDINIDFSAQQFTYKIIHYELIDDTDEGKHELRECQEKYKDASMCMLRQKALSKLYKNLSANVTVKWLGARENASLVSDGLLNAYYTTSIAKHGHLMASEKGKLYNELWYRNIYPNIDAHFYFQKAKEGIKYDLLLSPYASLADVKMNYSGHQGLSIDKEGNLHVQTPSGSIVEHAPSAHYASSLKKIIPVRFKLLDENTVGFDISDYDPSQTVIIDPWVTNPNFDGGNGGYDIAIDYAQNTYVYGGGREIGGNRIGADMIYQLKKFDPEGNLLWTYDSPVANNGFLGDLAVMRDGTSFICSGFFFEGANGVFDGNGLIKIGPDGVQVDNSGIINPGGAVFESWRLTYNKFTNSNWIYIGGGGSDGLQVGRISVNFENYEPFNSFGSPPDYDLKDVVYMAQEKDESFIYSTLAPNADPNDPLGSAFIKVNSQSLLNPEWQVQDGSPFVEIQQGDFMNGGGKTNGLNGIAVCRDYVYTYNGERLRAWDKTDGSVAFEVNTGGGFDATAGLDVDSCCRVYAGVGNTIRRYTPDLVFDEDFAVAGDNIHDLRFDPLNDRRLHVTGDDFVELIEFEGPCPECITTTGTNGVDCIGGSASVTVSDPNAIAPFSYIWTLNGVVIGTTQDVSDLEPGTYFVTVTDSRIPCPNQWIDTVTILVDCGISVSVNSDTICSGSCTTVQATVDGGSGNVTYTWDNDLPGTAGPHEVCPTETVSYCVQVYDQDADTTGEACGVITVVDINAEVSGDVTICKGETITLSATGGTSYLWSPDDGSLDDNTIPNPNASPLVTTTYEVSVRDEESGCEDTASVTVTVDSIVADAGPDRSICVGGSAQLQATGGDNYLWAPDDNTLSAINIDNPVAQPIVNQTYTVTVSNASGTCSDTDDVLVTVGNISVTISEDTTICAGQTLTLNASGGNTYIWSPDDGTLSDLNSANPIASPLQTTTYQVIVRDDIAGCEDTASVTIFVESVNADAGPDRSICVGGSLQLQASGGEVYLWSPDDNTLNDITISNPIVSPIISQLYTVTVSSASGTCTDTDDVLISVGDIVATAGNDTTICRGDTVALNADGGAIYSWSPMDNTLSDATIDSPLAWPATSTRYTVIVSDQSGICQDTAYVDIVVESLSTTLTIDPEIICPGDSSTIIAGGGNNYSWTFPDGTMTQGPLHTVKPNVTSTYSVTIQSTSGVCTADTFAIVAVEEITINVSSPLSVCRDAQLPLFASSPEAVSYRWTPETYLNNATIANPLASPLENISYTVIATSATGCEIEANVDVFVIDLLPSVSAESPICLGDFSQLNAAGGSLYRWTPTIGISNPNIANPVANPQETTTYTVAISDDSGNCEDTLTVELEVQSVDADAGPDTTICLGSTTSLSGSGGVQYLWMPSNLFINPNNREVSVTPILDSTVFTLQVSNELGCTDSDEVVVFTSSVSVDAQISPDIVELGEEIDLIALTDATWITWSTLNDIVPIYDGLYINSVSYSPVNSTIFRLIGRNEYECMDSAFVNIKVLSEIKIPNVFTPNDDGINDTWQIANITDYENAEVSIYNRWGNLVFQTSGGYNNNWNGTNGRNNQLPIGTYYYKIDLNFRGRTFAGDVTILR